MFGVKGWVKVYSNTDPIENITRYKPWKLCQNGVWRDVELKNGRRQGKTVVAQLDDLVDCEGAQLLIGAEIAVPEGCLPKLRNNEYYWADLIGLAVKNTTGDALGVVDKLLETGSNDVLVVANPAAGSKTEPLLVPWVLDTYVMEVDLSAGVITVDWDNDF